MPDQTQHLTTAKAGKILKRSGRQVQRYCELGLLGRLICGNYAITHEELAAFVTPPRGRRPHSPR